MEDLDGAGYELDYRPIMDLVWGKSSKLTLSRCKTSLNRR